MADVTTTQVERRDRAGTGARHARSVGGSAAAVYLAAWVIGLLVAPPAPSPGASALEVQEYFTDNRSTTLVQALLVHAIAGIALAVFVVALARCLARAASPRLRRTLVVAGVGAATVSLVQSGIEIALNRHVAARGAAATSADLFHAVNVADTVKLVLLAIAIGAATMLAARSGAFPRWLDALGAALGPLLIVGGLAFLIDSDALSTVLALSLILLLVWVAAVGFVLVRAGRAPVRG